MVTGARRGATGAWFTEAWLEEVRGGCGWSKVGIPTGPRFNGRNS